MKWVGIQRDQFRRLGIDGAWEDPYLTLDPRYEAGIMDVLADLVEAGYVFRQLKPIHWDIHDRTALAEAELEYADVTSPTVFVNFPIASGLPEALASAGGDWHAMIWTTTPWTLPANVAIAAHPDLEYAGIAYIDPESGRRIRTILAVDLVAKVTGLKGLTEVEEVARFRGRDLERRQLSPRLPATRRPVRPGRLRQRRGRHRPRPHRPRPRCRGLPDGPEIRPADPQPRRRGGPVHRRGAGPAHRQGRLPGESGGRRACSGRPAHLFHEMPVQHSYPHGWRSKKPVIFRATYQWFIGVDRNELRQRTLEAIDARDLAPRLGQVPDRGDGERPPRLVHQPPARLGRADPRVLLREDAASST